MTSISPPPASSSSSSRLPAADPMSEDEAGVRNRVIDANSGPERGETEVFDFLILSSNQE